MTPEVFLWPERWNVSHHATERWLERVGNTTCTWCARRLIQAAADKSVLVPNRLAAQVWVRKLFAEAIPIKRRLGCRYRIHGSVVLVISGQTIVTILKATDDELATVFVWLATGSWLGGDVIDLPRTA